jgi:hypothetical protein
MDDAEVRMNKTRSHLTKFSELSRRLKHFLKFFDFGQLGDPFGFCFSPKGKSNEVTFTLHRRCKARAKGESPSLALCTFGAKQKPKVQGEKQRQIECLRKGQANLQPSWRIKPHGRKDQGLCNQKVQRLGSEY